MHGRNGSWFSKQPKCKAKPCTQLGETSRVVGTGKARHGLYNTYSPIFHPSEKNPTLLGQTVACRYLVLFYPLATLRLIFPRHIAAIWLCVLGIAQVSLQLPVCVGWVPGSLACRHIQGPDGFFHKCLTESGSWAWSVLGHVWKPCLLAAKYFRKFGPGLLGYVRVMSCQVFSCAGVLVYIDLYLCFPRSSANAFKKPSACSGSCPVGQWLGGGRGCCEGYPTK